MESPKTLWLGSFFPVEVVTISLSSPGYVQSSIPSERTCRSCLTWLHWAALSQVVSVAWVVSVSMVLAVEYGHRWGWLPLGPAEMLIWTGGSGVIRRCQLDKRLSMSSIGYFCSSHHTVQTHETHNPTHSKEGVAKWDHYLSWSWNRQSRHCKPCQLACSIISLSIIEGSLEV